MEFLDQVISFSISLHLLLGMVCLILAAFFRFIAVANWGRCGRMLRTVNPPVYGPPPPPPIVIVAQGVSGCVVGSMMSVLWLTLFLEGIDQLLFMGTVTQWFGSLVGFQF